MPSRLKEGKHGCKMFAELLARCTSVQFPVDRQARRREEERPWERGWLIVARDAWRTVLVESILRKSCIKA